MRMLVLITAAALGLPAANVASAGDDAATACCPAACKKVCRVVCEMKKVEKIVWVVQCEEFCVPNPSCRREGCGCENGCAQCRGKSCPTPPQCGPVRCRKKLVQKTITCEVPVYKCVVVSCGCGECSPHAGGMSTSASARAQAYLPAPLPRN